MSQGAEGEKEKGTGEGREGRGTTKTSLLNDKIPSYKDGLFQFHWI